MRVFSARSFRSFKKIRTASALVLVVIAVSSCQSMFRKGAPLGGFDHSIKKGSGNGNETLGQPKKKVLVLKFYNDTPVPQENSGEVAAEELRNLLATSEQVLVIPDTAVSLKTEDFIQGDKIKVAQLIQEGRKQGVSLVLLGRIAKMAIRQKGEAVGLLRKRYSYATSDLEVKLFDVQAGREVLASFKSGEAVDSGLIVFQGNGIDDPAFRADLTEQSIRQAVIGFVPEILKTVDKAVWQGRIAKVSGQKIFINSGRASGLLHGDILRVLSSGEDIYDPTTGAYLGRSQGQLKGTLEIIDFFGFDGGLAQIHTGGGFEEGDLVQLY